MSMEDLYFRIERQYTQTEERIRLIQIVQKRQASKFWRIWKTLKGWKK